MNFKKLVLKQLSYLFLLFLIFSKVSFAARLEDIKILSVKPGQENFELKLQSKDAPKDSYFYIDIVKSDPDSFEKMAHLIKKIMKRDQYKLDLEIPSFSASPNGSFYRSEGIQFFGTADRQPNATVKPLKKNKK
jgi:hypothetical protein